MKTESNWKGTLHRARVILGRHSLWRAGLGRSSKYGVAFAFLLALPQFALAADKKEANVTEVVRDVRLLAAQAMHLAAALPEIAYACELGEFDRLLDDPFEGIEIENGRLNLPEGPGSGVSLRAQATAAPARKQAARLN